MNRWQMIRENWAVYLAVAVCGLFVAITAIGSFMVDAPKSPDAAPTPSVEPAQEPDEPELPAPEPEPTPRVHIVPIIPPHNADELDKLQEDLRDESAEHVDTTDDASKSTKLDSYENSPCECTPTCPCDAEHCQCRGKERCSEVCPCHKVVAKFWCPKCQRAGYCDMEPDDKPHRVCRDCKQWMDRLEPPMTAQEGYDVIVWRRVQVKMQAEAKAREQAAKAEAERRKQRSSMPVYDPFDEDMPNWRPRRFYFNQTSMPATNCRT